MGYNITNIDGDLAIGRNAEIGCDADIHGKARVAGSLKVEGFLDAPNIKGVVKGLFVTEQELNREYPNPRPGWSAIVLADDERGFLYLAKNREWEKQSEEAKPFEFIVDSINVFASKGELEDERSRATEAENNIKSQALQTDTVHFSQGTRGVSLGGRSIDGKSVVDKLIPVATTEMPGAMSPEDKVQILNNKKDIENLNTNITELSTALADGSFVVGVAKLAEAVKVGAVTFEMLDGKLRLSVSVVDDLETANTLKPLSANQGKVLKELIDVINGTGEGSTDKKITDAIAALVDSAPENLDTLRELAEWIAKHGAEFAAVVADINNIKNDALLTSSVHVSQYAEKINIGGRSLDGANTMSVDIPAATPEKAGVMSAEQVKALQAHSENLANLNTTILNYNREIRNYAPVDKATVVANLGTAVERGMIVTYYTADGWKSIRYISSQSTAEAFANVDNWEDVDDFSAKDKKTLNRAVLSFDVLPDRDSVDIACENAETELTGVHPTFEIPAATTETAGVMSAEDKIFIYPSYGNLNLALKELYIEGINDVADYHQLTLRIINISAYRQITLFANYDAAPLCNYWVDKNFIDKGIIKLVESQSSGITAYAFVDFTKVEDEISIAITNNNVKVVSYSPSIAAHLNEENIKNIEHNVLPNVDKLIAISRTYTDNFDVQVVLPELYIKANSISACPLPTIKIIDGDGFQQATIYANYDADPIANYWSQTKIDRGVIELKPYGDNGLSAYAFVDFTRIEDVLVVDLTGNKDVLNIENSPRISSYINSNNKYDIENLKSTDDKLSSYCSYRNDLDYSDVVKELYVPNIGDITSYPYLVIRIINDTAFRQVTLFANYDAEPLCNYWVDKNFIDKGIIKLDEYQSSGITAYAFVDFTKVEDKISIAITNNNIKLISYSPSIAAHLNAESIANLKQSTTSKWFGKRLLAIGASITTEFSWEKKWPSKCADILGMNVRVHAKGGIGLIQMVDGDGSGDAPEGYDPDSYGVNTIYRLNEADVADVDVIVLHGMYNERRIARENFGEDTDMYPIQNTYMGRLQYAVSRIYEELEKAGNKNCKVVICSAHKYGKYPYVDLSAYDDGEPIRLGAEMVAKYHSLYFIDLMNYGNFNKYNWSYFSASSSPYNANYLPADGALDGTNKPYASLDVAPDASSNTGKYITVTGKDGCYKSDGTSWVWEYTGAIWNGDQLHLNQDGYQRMAEYIAGQLMTI